MTFRHPRFALFLPLAIFSLTLNVWLIQHLPCADTPEWLIGAQEILKGKLVYRDFFIHVGPLTPYIVSAAFALLPVHIFTAGALFASANMATAAGVYKVSRLWLAKESSVFAAIAYSLTVPFFGGSEMFAESFGALLGTWGLFFLFRKNRTRPHLIFGTSLLLGAFLTKQTSLFFFVGWSWAKLVEAIKNDEEERQKIISEMVQVGTLFAGGFLMVCLYFLSKNVLSEFLYDFFVFNFSEGSPGAPKVNFLHMIASVAPWLFFLGLYGWTGRPKENPISMSLILIVGLSLLQCLAVPHYHYFMIGLPSLCILAGRGGWLLMEVRSPRWKRVGLGILLLLCAPTLGRASLAVLRPFGIPAPLFDALKKTPLQLGMKEPSSLFIEIAEARKLYPLIENSKSFFTNYEMYYFFFDRSPLWTQGNLFGHNTAWPISVFKKIDAALIIKTRENASFDPTVLMKLNSANLKSKLIPASGYAESVLYFFKEEN